MKGFKRTIATVLITSLVLNLSGVCTLADGLYNESILDKIETTESKIVEQLKDDLGEEKATQILLSSKNNDSDETTTTIVEPEIDNYYSEGEDNHGEYDEEPEEDGSLPEESIDVTESINNELDLYESKNNDETTTIESLDNESLTTFLDDTQLIDETTINNIVPLEMNRNNKNLDLESKTNNIDNITIIASESNVENDLENMSTEDEIEHISTKSELNLSISNNVNNSLFGTSEPWMYWYLTDEGQTIHYTSIYNQNLEMNPITNNNYIEYENLNIFNIKNAVFDNIINAKTCHDFFYHFTALEKIENLNFLNTSEVTSMANMFNKCKKLSYVDVSNFDTSNVLIMTGMFSCGELSFGILNSSLENIIGLNNFNTSKVIDMSKMFSYCSKISNIDLSNFNTSNVTTMREMFLYCKNLSILNINSFNTLNVTDISSMFSFCSNLVNIDISNFDTRNLLYMNKLFNMCTNLSSINLSNFNTSNVIEMSCIFADCDSLSNIDISNFDTNNVLDLSGIFSGCINLVEINLSNLNTSNVKYMDYMFYHCDKLNNIDVSNFNTSNVTNMSHMFSNCENLNYINILNFDTSNVKYMDSMFSNSTNLLYLDLSSFNTIKLQSTKEMFNNCISLQTIYVSNNFVTNNILNSDDSKDMFYYCNNLIGGNGTHYDNWHRNIEYARIDKLGFPGYFTLKNSISYTIKFDLCGLKATTPSNIVKESNVNIQLPIPTNMPSKYNFDGWYKEKSYNNKYSGNTDLSNINGDIIILYAKYTKKNPFDTTKNAWKFKNYSSKIKRELYKKVLGESITKLLIHDDEFGNNNGICYGMAGLSKIFYDNKINFKLSFPNYENLNSLNKYDNVKNVLDSNYQQIYNCEDIIKMAYLYQFTNESLNEIQTNYNLSEIDSINNTLNINKIINSLENDNICTVFIYNINNGSLNDNNWGHALLAYDYVDDEYIKVYDCNFPNDNDCWIKINKNSNNNFDWYYNKLVNVGYDENHSNIDLNDKLIYGNQISYEKLLVYANKKINDCEINNMYLKTDLNNLNLKLNNQNLILDKNCKYYYNKIGVLLDENNNVIKNTDNSNLFILPLNNDIEIENQNNNGMDLVVVNKNLIVIKSDDINNASIKYNDNSDNVYLKGNIDDAFSLTYSINDDSSIFDEIIIDGKLKNINLEVEYIEDNKISLIDTKISSISCSFKDGKNAIITIPDTETNFDYNICIENNNGSNIIVAKNLSGLPLYSTADYNVVFDTDGGSIIATQSVTFNDLAIEPIVSPTKIGYNFIGWYKNYERNEIFNFENERINNNTVIYAKWEPKTYKIRYITNEGTITGSTNFTKTYGTPLSGLKTPSRLNYNFDGWYSDNQYESKYDFTKDDIYIEGQETTPINIYAKWTYKIKLNLNNVNAIASESIIKTFGIDLNESSLDNIIPVDNRYIFDGWFKTNNSWDDDSKYNLSDLDPDSNNEANIYAKWKVEFLLNINGHGNFDSGELQATNSCVLNESVTLPTLEQPGYTFNGWCDNSSCEGDMIGTGDSYMVTAPKTLYAKWTANSYNINYNTNVEGISAPTPTLKTYDNLCELSTPSIIPNGYIFDGWYSNAGLADTDKYNGDRDLTTGTTDQTVFARWKIIISFDNKGHGATLSNIELIRNTGEIELPQLTTIGWTLGGWYTSATIFSDDNKKNDGDTFTEPTKLYAKWDGVDYRVKYNTNGGEITGGSTFTKTYGTPINVLKTPIKTGYTFDGWYTDNTTFNNLYDSTKDDIYEEGHEEPYNIYAKWNAKSYTINYNANDGTITGATSFTKTYGSAYSGTLTTPTKTGYTFGGWYRDNETFENQYNKSNDDIYVEGQTDPYYIYAKWNPKTYTVKYNANGGTVSPASFIKTYNTAITTDLAVPIKTGYTFDRWYTDNTTFNNAYDKTTDAIYVDGTTTYSIFAKWNENTYNVTLHLDGGAFDTGYTEFILNTTTGNYERSRLYHEGTELPTNQIISKTGYTFDGWYDNQSCQGQKMFNVMSLTNGNKDYYAKWNENSYSITYNENGGTYVSGYSKPTSRLYTANTLLPNNTQISKTGYTFGGWYDNSDFTGSAITSIGPNVAAPKVVYAKWHEITYSVTYKDYDGSNLTNANWKAGYTAPTSRKYTESLPLPGDGNVIKTNSFFLGWFKEGDANETIITSINANTAENYIVRAKWDTGYEVTFNYSGYGTNTTDLVRSGNRVGKPADPTYNNRRFAGWYKTYNPGGATLDEQFTDPYNFNSQVTESFTLYAKWEDATTYEVTFNLTSGTVHPEQTAITQAPANQYIVSGNKVMQPSSPVSNGYIFKGWWTSADNNAQQWDFDAFQISATQTIYAHWELITYTITYNINNGSWQEGYTKPESWTWTTANSTVIPTGTNITRNHYTFGGWYMNSDLSGAQVSSLTGITTNLTLYAKWTFNPGTATYHTINFLSGGGSGSMSSQYAFEGEDTTLNTNTFEKPGYTFNKWISSNGTTYTNNQNIGRVNSDLVLTADWNINQSPYTPRPYYPSSGGYSGGGGGGGGGGGRVAGNQTVIGVNPLTNYNMQNSNDNAIFIIQINNNKFIKGSFDSDNTTWVKDIQTGKYKFQTKNGTYTKDGFYLINNIIKIDKDINKMTTDTYYFDSQGNMVTGWIKTADNKWFFFENEKNSNEGKMALGWKKIKEKYYYFSKDGSMLVNALTPDGFIVGSDGAYIN